METPDLGACFFFFLSDCRSSKNFQVLFRFVEVAWGKKKYIPVFQNLTHVISARVEIVRSNSLLNCTDLLIDVGN